MIWIIGGTSEADELAERLEKRGLEYIMSIAAGDGKDFFKTRNTKIGRMTKEGMLYFCKTEKITTIADISRPYAALVSENAKAAAETLHLHYLRFIRTQTADTASGRHFADIASLSAFLQTLKKRQSFLQQAQKTLETLNPSAGTAALCTAFYPQRTA